MLAAFPGIERAVIEDAERILTLQKIAYADEARLYENYALPPLIQTLEDIRQEFQHRVFLKAVKDGEIVGSVRGAMQNGECAIGRLVVHPDWQRQGIGERLMRAVERYFSRARRFELFIGHRSQGNLRFYSRLGYSPFRREPVSETLTMVYLEKIPALEAQQ